MMEWFEMGQTGNHIAVFSQLQSVYVLFTRRRHHIPRLLAQFTLGLAC